MSDYDDFDSDYYDDYDDYDSYEEGGYYDESTGGGYDEEYDYYEDPADDPQDYTSSDFDLDDLIDREADEPTPEGKKSNRLFIIIGAVVGVFVILPLVCFLGFTVIGGIGVLSFLSGQEAAVEATPIATIAPIAEVVLPDTPTPEPSPTPTAVPVGAEFINPADGTKIDLGQSIEVQVQVVDGQGITSVSLEGSGLAPQNFNGESEVLFTQRWAPENAGFYTLNVTVRNRLGETNRVPGVYVQVVDREFIQSNAATFSTLDTNVGNLRQLTLLNPVEPTLMGIEGVKRYLRSEYSQEDAFEEMLILSSFDFVPRGFDLYEPAVEYTASGIAGFYDPESKIFVMVSTDNKLDTYEQYIYVHELMHALQDQHFELGLISAGDVLNGDELQALRALAEGEAELLQELYINNGYFSNAEMADIQNISEIRIRNLAAVQQRSQAPEIWSSAFLFAYENGLEFNRTLYNRFGWDGINNAWADRPVSTEQILHPDRYINGDLPQNVSIVNMAEVLGENWREIENNTFGEFYLREYLSQRVDERTVDQAATGWGGDNYVIYYNETAGQSVMAIRLAWDSPADSEQFGGAFSAYANAAYGNPVEETADGVRCRAVAVEVVCSASLLGDWLIVRAPNMEIAKAVIAAQR